MISQDNNLQDQLEELQGLSYGFRQAVSLLRWLGYGLLLFSLFDWVDTLTPLKLMNPSWEFQTIGSLVDKVVVPLFGFGFVFVGGAINRRSWERSLLKIVSWLALLIGIFYLLMVPLGLLNTVRLNEMGRTQVLGQTEKQTAPLKEIKKQVVSVSNEAELNELLAKLGKAGLVVKPKPDQSFETVKADLTKFLGETQAKIEKQYKEVRSNQQFGLLKNSIKWNLGAAVAGVLFIGIWQMTSWARSRY
ncbi:MAG: HpsJ-like protein, cyanoexosortase A-associated [Microcystaceae cyanobacterium]